MNREGREPMEVRPSFFMGESSPLRSGDVVLFSYPRVGPGRLLRACIAHVQRGLLGDLGYTEAYADWHGHFTHAGLHSLGQNGCILEMTVPRARVGRWEDVPDGTLVLARRPGLAMNGEWRDADVFRRWLASTIGMDECLDGPRYPYLELFSYWVWHLWIGKLALGRRFRELFSDEKRDVCSGSVWRWLRHAGLYRELDGKTDSLPEAWYPGRLAADREHFRDIGLYRLRH